MEVASVFLLTMPGVPYIYSGDEIGMAQVEGLVSKAGGYGRTGARTPMQWDNAGKNAGFSSANAGRLSVPVAPREDRRPNVAAQERDEHSLLGAVRRLAAAARVSAWRHRRTESPK